MYENFDPMLNVIFIFKSFIHFVEAFLFFSFLEQNILNIL